MLGLVTRDWWVFAIRGIAALTFGILAFIWPETTLTVLVLLFGAYVLVDGVALLVALVRGDALARRHAWAVAIMGVLGIVVGVVTFACAGPDGPVAALPRCLLGDRDGHVPGHRGHRPPARARWRVLDGTRRRRLDRLRRAARRLPGRGTALAVWLVGIWSVVFGVSSLGLAYRLHELGTALAKPAKTVAAAH